MSRAVLRCCAASSCMWVFRLTAETKASGCPKCGFGHYGARYVFGKLAYTYEETQKPWLDAQTSKLRDEIRKTAKPRRTHRKKPNQWQQWLAVRAEIEGID